MLLIYMQHDNCTMTHVRKHTEEKALCGFHHRSYASSFDSPIVDTSWLNQPTQEYLCQKCKKAAFKILTSQKRKS
jgi:hypothetical protein